MSEWAWFDAELDTGLQLGLKVTKRIYEEETGQQKLVIFESAGFGRIMALDGIIQITERDEFIYSEMMAHVPILAHTTAEEVMIIGGGDGAVLEEVLKHASVRHVTLVEIDPHVVELCREYLPSVSKGAFDDSRCELIFADGAKFVRETDRRADVVIVDSTDSIGPGTDLFSAEFYAGCHRCLRPGGILVTQNGVPFVQAQELQESCRHLRRSFRDVTCYTASVPTYNGGPMAFGWACDDPAKRNPALGTLTDGYRASGIDTDYYSPAIHVAAFSLPNYIARLTG